MTKIPFCYTPRGRSPPKELVNPDCAIELQITPWLKLLLTVAPKSDATSRVEADKGKPRTSLNCALSNLSPLLDGRK